MKKLTTALLVIAMSGFTLPSFSQAQLSIGLKGGLNFSKLDLNSSVATNYDNRTGYHAGLFTLVKLGPIGIQPEILFSKQGSTYTINTTNYEANFDYINVPIILKFYLPLKINLQAGPQFGFLSSHELVSSVSGTDPKSAAELFSKTSDVAIAVGAGWDLPFGLTVDFRYNIGLSDIEIQPSTSQPVTFKNKVIQLSVGYKIFKFGK